MSVIEKFASISNNITRLFDFIANDEDVKGDFNDYLNTISAQNMNSAQLQGMLIPYVFERRLTDERKSIIDLYLEKNTKIDKFDKAVLKALKTSFSSVFEVKKVLQNGFELYNLVNEKTYNVISLVKMTNYRGLYAGQYVMARIFCFEKEYYVLEIPNVISPANKEEVQRFAIAKIIETPEVAYDDNPKKFKEIEKIVAEYGKKFLECFGKDEIMTTNHCADNIINAFNNFCDDKENFNVDDIENNIQKVPEYRYFKVEEFNNSYDNFMEKSLNGFSSHKSLYDVAIIYDEELGLFAIPFYETLTKIFESDDYTSIPGYIACVKNFLENDKIPANIIKRVMDKYPVFLERTNKILQTKYTVDELLNHYKADSLEKKIFSSTSVLYSSKVFSDAVGIVNEEIEEAQNPKPQYENVGRNEPCPCGSGKKFKKCCGQTL